MATTDSIEFTVNGAPVRPGVATRTLLGALREDSGLKGARFGCGEGQCGACTVIVDDRALQACQTPLWSIAGARVTTIEGLDRDPVGRRVREVIHDEQAAQCGYCTNGIIMTLVALLSAEAQPERRDILKTLDERHLCRCGAHPRIIRAIDRLLAERARPRP